MASAGERREITEQRFNRLIVAGVALGFLALLASGVGALLTVGQNQRHTYWVHHTYQVERQVSGFRVRLEQAEALRRGLLLSDNPRIRSAFLATIDRVGPELDGVAALTRDNPRQQANVAATRALLRDEVADLRRSFSLTERGLRDQGVAAFRQTRDAQLMRRLRGRTEAMLAEEDRLLAARTGAQQGSLARFNLILALSGVLLVAVGLVSIRVILRYTRDLQASRRALRRLNDDLEGAVAERTADLSRANEEIQRFAYIVSHDLRSPLVNVMGFTAELETGRDALAGLVERVEADAPALLTREAKLAAEEDLPEAIGFIRTSTAKMDRLINAILRLSREGRRPITPERLDMDKLAQGVVDSLKHRSDELGASVTVAPRLPAITSDRLAVEQILSNLAENALKYLQPGRPGTVALDGRREGARAVFTVSDNGRGIDPRDHGRVFDLFRRSGVQDQPGEGIGLAHVRALAYRLGGTVTVDSALGEGARFRVALPMILAGKGATP